ncbi:MAG: translation initiation factor IF-2 [Patescibacteria group bacterium]|jgi:translation initiation factor IF-2
MNLSELARRLKVSPNDLKENLPKLGFDIGRKAIKVDDRVATKILRTYAAAMRDIEHRQKEEKKQAEIQEAVAAASTGVALPSEITVRELAETLGISVPLLMTELLKNGILSSVNERLDFATAAVVAEDLGFTVKEKGESGSGEGTVGVAETLKRVLLNVETQPRPPVVVVMGHVDHGKTTLLDAIRKSDVAARESGGITQHIGAYQVRHEGKIITFIDTPGHEAFRTMRSRGAKVADIAILVVAADDGLKPQTHEALGMIQGAGLPFVVAINKTDKPGANIERVKQELAAINLLPEDWGGKTICVPISAKSGENIDKLLEMVLLVADLYAERIVADAGASALGSVIEARVDPGEGPVATLLVQNGTLHQDDVLVHGDSFVGKARVLKNYLGEVVREALPSTPIRILGLKDAPEVGDVLEVSDPLKEYKTAKRKRLRRQSSAVTITAPRDDSEAAGQKVMPVVVKTDVLGSLEAILESIEKLSQPEVRVQVVSKGLGNITEGDVQRASATANAFIAAFRVQTTKEAAALADELKVDIKRYDVIYSLINDLKAKISAELTPEIIHTDLGEGKILKIFIQEAKRQVVGVRVTKGLAKVDATIAIRRQGERIGTGIIKKIQSGKEEIREAASSSECGFEIISAPKLAEGDMMDIFTEVEQRRFIA